MERIVRKVILILGVGANISWCEPPVPNSQYGVPGNFGGGHTSNVDNGSHGGSGEVTNSYGAPLTGGHGAHQDYIDGQPKSYEFGYAVKDAVSGNDFGRRETSDGETVRGEYRVQLPDGRTQIVTYTADWRTGFHADVRYEGVASYPDQYNNNNNNNNNHNHNHNNNNIVNNGNGYNNAGTGYNDLIANTGFGTTGYNGGGGIDQGYSSNSYQSINNNGNYNSGFNHGGSSNSNSNSNSNYDTNGHNYNGNANSNSNYNHVNSLDESGYNYAGYSSNSFGTKAPVSTYGTPAFH